jgi:YesN/AraC family two-component response regulator
LKEMLLRLDCEVLTAASGSEALEKLSVGGVDLVVTDIVMPDLDGLELIANIYWVFKKRSHYKNIFVCIKYKYRRN